MLEETGTVVRIEPDALWVEMVQKSACGTCVAQKGCGHHSLSKALSGSSIIRVLLNGKSGKDFYLNQSVNVGIPEDVVVKGSLFVYLLPLVLMMLFSSSGFFLFGSDIASVLFAATGLLFGGFLVWRRSVKTQHDPRNQPVLM